MPLEFGKKPSCIDCDVELTRENRSVVKNGYCRFCKPQPPKERRGKYSGQSQTPYGEYEDR